MLWVDGMALGVVVVSALFGLLRGMIREVLSLLAWVLGLYAAWRFGPHGLAPALPPVVPQWLRIPLADLLIFLGFVIAGTLLALLVRKIFYGVGLGGPDRLLGAVFGVLRGVLLIAVLAFGVQSSALAQASWWRQSWLAQAGVVLVSHAVTGPAVALLESSSLAK